MILGSEVLKERIENGGLVLVYNQTIKKPLIENFESLDQLEGVTFDLRLERVFELEGNLEILKESRKTPVIFHEDAWGLSKTRSERPYSSFYYILPGKYYLITTKEIINMHLDLTGIIKPRTTTFRGGLMLRAGFVNPNYQGQLTFGLFNLHKTEAKIEVGARIASIIFQNIEGEIIPYQGVWQGGKISTGGDKERPY